MQKIKYATKPSPSDPTSSWTCQFLFWNTQGLSSACSCSLTPVDHQRRAKNCFFSVSLQSTGRAKRFSFPKRAALLERYRSWPLVHITFNVLQQTAEKHSAAMSSDGDKLLLRALVSLSWNGKNVVQGSKKIVDADAFHQEMFGEFGCSQVPWDVLNRSLPQRFLMPQREVANWLIPGWNNWFFDPVGRWRRCFLGQAASLVCRQKTQLVYIFYSLHLTIRLLSHRRLNTMGANGKKIDRAN